MISEIPSAKVAFETQPEGLWRLGTNGQDLTGAVFAAPAKVLIDINSEELLATPSNYKDLFAHIIVISTGPTRNFYPNNFGIPFLPLVPEQREGKWVATVSVAGIMYHCINSGIRLRVEILKNETREDYKLGRLVIGTVDSEVI